MLSRPKTRILLEAAFIAIEILSPEDRMTRVIERLQEFEALGTPHIWLIDPESREMFIFRDGSLLEVKGDVLATDNPRLELTRGNLQGFRLANFCRKTRKLLMRQQL